MAMLSSRTHCAAARAELLSISINCDTEAAGTPQGLECAQALIRAACTVEDLRQEGIETVVSYRIGPPNPAYLMTLAKASMRDICTWLAHQ